MKIGYVIVLYMNGVKLKYNTITRNPDNADILWLVAGWCWKTCSNEFIKK